MHQQPPHAPRSPKSRSTSSHRPGVAGTTRGPVAGEKRDEAMGDAPRQYRLSLTRRARPGYRNLADRGSGSAPVKIRVMPPRIVLIAGLAAGCGGTSAPAVQPVPAPEECVL